MTRVLFWVVNGFVIAALALLAQLHADLAQRLVLGWLAAPIVVPRPGAAAPATPARRVDAARAILERNPFDSRWAPRSEPASLADLELCTSVGVHVVSQSPDASWSLASVVDQGGGGARLVRAGDALGSYAVVFVGQDPWHGRPTVWLRRRGVLCRAPLGAPSAVPPPPTRKFPWELPASMREGVHASGDGLVELDRATYTELLPNIARHLGPLRAVRPRGGERGAELRGVRPGSLLDLLGLRSGDVVESVNGHDVATPGGMMQAYPELLTERRFVVRLRRGGQPTSLEIRVR